MSNTHARVTPIDLSIEAIPAGTASIDVRFDDRRIWSIEIPESVCADPAPTSFAWPTALQPHLTGHTRLSIVDSASHAELTTCEARFDEQPHRTSVVDADGRPLMVNKWGHLGLSLEAMGPDAQRRILEDAASIVEHLNDLGLRPFVVGGTLLGGVRAATLLPHDDDADIAYLSVHKNPLDVALEALTLGRTLSTLGYEVLHHSATHLQLSFPGVPGQPGSPPSPGHYIDVFAAFFTRDGNINQPFHVRGPMTESQMLPFGTVTIDGFEFPAPADVDHWLTLNYDKNWRQPIPGFKIVTPYETRSRFVPWFGGFNFQREFWDAHYADVNTTQPDDSSTDDWRVGREWLLSQDLNTSFVVDLGCGLGKLTQQLADANPDSQVLGLDFSAAALDRAPAGAADNLTFGRLNLNRRQSIALTRRFSITKPFSVVANHVFEQLSHEARENAWRIARMALRSGGAAYITFNAVPSHDVTFEDPSGWHLVREQVEAEASHFGLAVELTPLTEHADPDHPSYREATGAKLRIADHAPAPTRRTP